MLSDSDDRPGVGGSDRVVPRDLGDIRLTQVAPGSASN